MRHIKEYKQALNESKNQEDLNNQLWRAARNGNLRDVRVLLDRGADLNTRNEYGTTPLHRAAASGHTYIARLLIDRGADPNAENKEGSTPLHYAVAYGHTEIMRLLLDRDAKVDAMNTYGSTPLRSAVLYGHIETAKFLILKGADPFKAFEDPQKIFDFFNDNIDWMPEDLKRRLKLMKRSKKMFGM